MSEGRWWTRRDVVPPVVRRLRARTMSPVEVRLHRVLWVLVPLTAVVRGVLGHGWFLAASLIPVVILVPWVLPAAHRRQVFGH